MNRFVLIPLIVACALFMENMDSTVIATSLPAIAADIGESPIALKLALTSYLVSLAVFIPVSGWVADRIGARTVFSTAIVVFVAGSVLCALSESLVQFVAARFLQGVGGAMMVPVGRLVLLRTAPKSELVAALNWLTVPGLLGPVVGPPLGGFITVHFGWHWIFLINVPIGVLGLVLVLRFIPDLKEPEPVALDLRGFVLSSIGLAALVFGLSAVGGHLMPGPVAAACIAIGASALWGYWRHARAAANPLIDLKLLSLPTYRSGVLGGLAFRVGVGASPFLLPLMFQLGFGMDPFQSGLISCATAVGAMFMKTLTVAILRRFGFRSVLTVNTLVAGASVAACGFFTAATPWAVMVLVLVLSGCLRSLQFTAINAVSFSEIDRAAMSQASSLSSMTQRLAQSLGVVVGAVALETSAWLGGRAEPGAADFLPAFLVVGVLAMGSALSHRHLAPDAGSEVSGHRPGKPAGTG